MSKETRLKIKELQLKYLKLQLKYLKEERLQKLKVYNTILKDKKNCPFCKVNAELESNLISGCKKIYLIFLAILFTILSLPLTFGGKLRNVEQEIEDLEEEIKELKRCV